VKGWCQAKGFVDQVRHGMTAVRHAVLNTPVQTAGHPSSTAAAIAALAPGSLEPLTVLLQTGLVASASASAASASASAASLRLLLHASSSTHHRDQQQHTAATRGVMSEPPVIIPGAGYNPTGAIPVDAAANFHPIPVVHGSIQDAKPEPRFQSQGSGGKATPARASLAGTLLFLEATPPGDDQERKQAKAREEAVEGIEEKGEEQVKAVRKTEAKFRQRRGAALDFSKELRVERDARGKVLPRFEGKSMDRSGATAMPLGPGLTQSDSTFKWERTRKIGFNAHSWKEDNEDHGCPHVECCADPCDCKCGEAKGALVYVKDSLYIQCSEIFTLRNEKLHTEA
jgi:hypothetical protein